MAFPDELLDVALNLPDHSSELAAPQASLRRAVSSAYYALFHLLISEATANWARPELRAVLGRCFEHGPMKNASEPGQINKLIKQYPPATPGSTTVNNLHNVANTFVQAQQRRNDADYNLAKEWTPVEAYSQIVEVHDAFAAWKQICDETVAQAYLVSLLGAKGRRSSELLSPQGKTQGKGKRPGRGSPRK